MEEQYSSLRNIFKFIKPIYLGIILLILASIFGKMLEINYFAEYPSATNLSDIISNYDGIVALFMLLLRFIGFILFLVMFYKAYKNIRTSNNGETITTPGMAIAYYFIPILCLFKPYQTMRETYEWSYTKEDSLANTTIVTLWWTLVIIIVFVSRIVLTMVHNQTYRYIELISYVLELFLFIIELVILQRIYNWQNSKFINRQIVLK